jgi:hypothetical protein
MQLISTHQVSEETLHSQDFDIFLASSGFELRATYALKAIDLGRFKTKLAFGFEDRITHDREDNDRRFERAGVRVLPSAGDSGSLVHETVRNLVNEVPADAVRIFVDYSSMTRAWYAAIIKAIMGIRGKRVVECYFSYSPARFTAGVPRG